ANDIGSDYALYLSFLDNYFFFFQAEDGIRDGHVTGVQTCALPICNGPDDALGLYLKQMGAIPGRYWNLHGHAFPQSARCHEAAQIGRASLGKECRSRWSP